MRYNLKIIGLNLLFMSLFFIFFASLATAQDRLPRKVEDFSKNSLVVSSAKYLGATAESMAEIVDSVFGRYGTPDAIIRGEEAGAALVFGLRYGRGVLQLEEGGEYPLYWRGPSAGLDTGATASKSFTLVYNVNNPDDLYKRFGGVEGEAFFLGGIAVNYLQRGNTILATMRTGVGIKISLNIGYLKFSPEAGWLPF